MLQQVPPRLTYNHLDYKRNYVNEISHKSDSYDNKKKGEENKNKNKTKTFLLYSYSFLKILHYVELLGITVCVCVWF